MAAGVRPAQPVHDPDPFGRAKVLTDGREHVARVVLPSNISQAGASPSATAMTICTQSSRLSQQKPTRWGSFSLPDTSQSK